VIVEKPDLPVGLIFDRVGMDTLGHKLVFASDVNPDAITTITLKMWFRLTVAQDR
jgi:hypothetical protein